MGKIYKISQSFPPDEKFGATSQIRRSALSVPANLSEGVSRITGKEKARFTEIAFSSLMETLNHLIIAVDLGFFEEVQLNELRPDIDELANKMNALRKAQLKLK